MEEHSGTNTSSRGHGRPRRGGLLLRLLLAVIAVAVLLPLLLVGAGLLTLQTETGQRFLADTLESVLTDPGRMELKIGTLEGPLPQQLQLRDVEISDPEGNWLTLDRAELAWHPLALFERRLHIEMIEVGVLDIRRAPPPAETPSEDPPAPQEEVSFQLPELPVSIRLERLHAREIRLGEALLGTEARLTIDGSATAERGGPLNSHLEVERTDGTRGGIVLNASYDPQRRHLETDIEAHEPQGGLIAHALNIEGHPAVDLQLSGKGPLKDWRGRLDATAGQEIAVGADIAVTSLTPLRVDLESEARIGALLPVQFQDLVTPSIALSLQAVRRNNGELALDKGRLETPAARLTFSGELGADGQALSAQAFLEATNPQMLESFTAPAGFEQAQLHLSLRGPLSAPEATLDANLSGIETPQASIESGALSVQLTPEAPLEAPDSAIAFTLNADTQGLSFKTPELAQSLAREASLVARGTAQPNTLAFNLETLEGRFGSLSLDGSGGMDLQNAHSDLEVTLAHPHLAELQPLTNNAIQGALTGRLSARQRKGEPLEALLRIDLEDFATGIPAVDGLLGESPRLAGRLTRPQNAQTLNSHLMLVSRNLSATTKATVDIQDQIVQASYNLDLPSLAPLESVIGAPSQGAIRLEGKANGPLSGPAITAQLKSREAVLAGNRIENLESLLDMQLDQGRPSGDFSLEAGSPYGEFATRTGFALSDNGILSLENLTLRHGEDTRLTGDIGLPLSGTTPASGNLRGENIRLSRYSDLAGIALAGRLDLDLQLEDNEGRQSVSLDTSLGDFRLGPGDSPTVVLPHADIRLNVADALQSPALDGNATLTGLDASNVQLDQITAQLTGTPQAPAVTINGRGEAEKPLSFTLAGNGDLSGENPAFSLSRLNVDYGEIPLRLQQTLTISTGETLRIQGLDLALGEGRLRGGGSLNSQTADLNLALRALPLSLLREINPSLTTDGTAEADLVVSGASGNPNIDLELRLDNVQAQQEQELGGLPEVSGVISTRLSNRQLNVNANVSGFAERALEIQGEMPLHLALQPFAFNVRDDAPIEARASWNGDVSEIFGLLPVDDMYLAGPGDINLSVGGTLADPVLGGHVLLENAVFENFTTGTLLRPLNLEIRGREDQLEITRLETGDGGNGQLSGQGNVRFQEGEAILADLGVDFSNMTFVRRDDVTAQLTGNLTFEGDLMGRSELSGEIRNDSIEIRLVNELPPSVTELDNVVIVGEDTQAGEETDDNGEEETAEESSGPIIGLDLVIDLPRRVFVRGRGLDSEWAGRFQVQGTASNPVVTGSLEPQRGTFSFVGKSFRLQRGSVTLPPGSDLNPELDLSAVANTGEIEAIIRILGTASSPRIELASNPPLPEDEVLSRVLFNKNSSNLTAGEALQLANAAATLSSGGPGVTDFARNLLGTDMVSFSAGGEDNELGSVSVGQYIAEGVYVGVEQGTRAGSTEVKVELDVTDNIKVTGGSGANGQGRVGVQWEWNY